MRVWLRSGNWRWLLRGRFGGPVGRRGGGWPLVLALVGIWACVSILRALWTVFQHAYLGSYYFVPGARVASVYWSSIRFALVGTVLVVLLALVLVGLVAYEVARMRRRW